MTGLDEDYWAARLLCARLGYVDAGRGPYISSAAIVDANGERQIFFGVLTYLTKTLG